MKSFLSLSLSFIFFCCYGQGYKVVYTHGSNYKELPIYKSGKDSIQLVQLQSTIEEKANATKIDRKEIDSLLRVERKIRGTAITGYRKSFYPTKDFISFDSLFKIKDRSTITKLSISSVSTKEIPSEVFTCPNLEELELVNTSVTKIPRKLNRLSHLTTLSVYHNRSGKSIKLKRNKNIKTLIIRSLDAAQLPKSYSSFKRLVKLNLADNNLKHFPAEAVNHPTLKELVLHHNSISSIAENIKYTYRLEKLDLGSNQLKKINSSIKKFQYIKTLKLDNNLIEEIDGAIIHLQNLEEFVLYNNQLVHLPKEIYLLGNLKIIDLHHNHLEKLDMQPGQWQKLETLYAAFNNIYSISSAMGGLNHLQELYLHTNRLSSMPSTIGELSNLKILRINNNLLTEIPSSISRLKKMENLDISNNSLSSVSDDFFQFPELKILSVVNNPWDAASKDYLDQLTKTLRSKGISVHLNSFSDDEVE
jgi:Leucine-rich repeat (LRR) protein